MSICGASEVYPRGNVNVPSIKQGVYGVKEGIGVEFSFRAMRGNYGLYSYRFLTEDGIYNVFSNRGVIMVGNFCV